MRKPHKERKLEIIQSTLDLSAELGVKKVTTQAIADHIGVSQATIFRHFKTRDDIFADAIEWLANSLFETLSDCFNNKLAADKQLQKLLTKQLHFISKNKGIPRLLFSDRLHLESPVLKKSVQQIMQRYTKQVATLIQQGAESGDFRKDIDADKAAVFVAALIQGSIIRWSIFDFNFDLEAEANELWRFIRASLIYVPKEPI